jgi:hypothetical protein
MFIDLTGKAVGSCGTVLGIGGHGRLSQGMGMITPCAKTLSDVNKTVRKAKSPKRIGLRFIFSPFFRPKTRGTLRSDFMPFERTANIKLAAQMQLFKGVFE